jgi:hypothetical protein
MMAEKIMTVENRLMTLGSLSLQKALCNAQPLSCHVNRRWNSATMAPSNSDPRPMLTVVGEKALSDDGLADIGGDEKVDAGSETVNLLSSSRRMTMRAATMSWMIRRRQKPAPRSFCWPYKPVRTYTVA